MPSRQTAEEVPISHPLLRHRVAELLVAAGELINLRGSDANKNRYAQRGQTSGIHGFMICDSHSFKSKSEGP